MMTTTESWRPASDGASIALPAAPRRWRPNRVGKSLFAAGGASTTAIASRDRTGKLISVRVQSLAFAGRERRQAVVDWWRCGGELDLDQVRLIWIGLG